MSKLFKTLRILFFTQSPEWIRWPSPILWPARLLCQEKRKPKVSPHVCRGREVPSWHFFHISLIVTQPHYPNLREFGPARGHEVGLRRLCLRRLSDSCKLLLPKWSAPWFLSSEPTSPQRKRTGQWEWERERESKWEHYVSYQAPEHRFPE